MRIRARGPKVSRQPVPGPDPFEGLFSDRWAGAEAAARAEAARTGTFIPAWAMDAANQQAWRGIGDADLTPLETALVKDVQNASEVLAGRSINIHNRGFFVLDEWLMARGIRWNQRWQDVYNRGLYLRTSGGKPVNVLAGGGYTAGEVEAAEEGARAGGIHNRPFWPDATPRPVGKTSTTPSVEEEVGAPLEPVVEATPGFNPARGAAVGGAVQMIQAMQIASLQRTEVEKFEKRYAELQPKIEAFLSKGYSVELTLIVEKPNTVDVLAGFFRDSSQLTYFHALYISRAESVQQVVRPVSPNTTRSTIGPVGGRDSVIPYTYQGGSLIEEREIPYLPTRDKYHHPVYAKEIVYPRSAVSVVATTPARRPSAAAKPPLDSATRAALAAAPSRVHVHTANINQYRTALRVMKKLSGNALFGAVTESMGGGHGGVRTVVVYFSDLDRPRAEALAEIVRAEGLPSTRAEMSGSGDDAPGSVQIMFGSDAENDRSTGGR